MAEICGYCKKNNAYCSYLKGIPICGVCLERYFYDKNTFEKKEATTMQVTYNGFIGELVKLEREDLRAFGVKDRIYNLSIYDSEHRVTHSFAGVKLEDVKFLSGEVSFK